MMTTREFIKQLGVDESWNEGKAFENLKNNKGLMKTILNLYSTEKVSPEPRNVFAAFKMDLYSINTIIIAAQPTISSNGLAMGSEGMPDIISKKMLLVLENDPNYDHTFETFRKNGTLLLNTTLTINKFQKELGLKTIVDGSHTVLWKTFISDVMKDISNLISHVPVITFGRKAEYFLKFLKDGDTFPHIKAPCIFETVSVKEYKKAFIEAEYLAQTFNISS